MLIIKKNEKDMSFSMSSSFFFSLSWINVSSTIFDAVWLMVGIEISRSWSFFLFCFHYYYCYIVILYLVDAAAYRYIDIITHGLSHIYIYTHAHTEVNNHNYWLLIVTKCWDGKNFFRSSLSLFFDDPCNISNIQ